MLDRALQALDRVLVVISAIAMFVMLGITTASVIGRMLSKGLPPCGPGQTDCGWIIPPKLFVPIPDDIVMQELLIVFLVFLPFAYVQYLKQHVFVTLFTDYMPARAQSLCETLGNLIGFVFFCFLTVASYNDFYGAWEVKAYSEGVLELPEYPSRFAVFFAITIMTIRLALDSLVSVRHIISGEAPEKAELH